MKKKGSVLLLLLIMLTPLLLMSACLWRSTAYSVDLVHAWHEAEQRHQFTKAGLVLVLKKLNAQQPLSDMSFKPWPDASFGYEIKITIHADTQATALLYLKGIKVCSLSAHYILNNGIYTVYYDPAL